MGGCCDLSEIERQIGELYALIYTPGYSTTLSGYSVFIAPYRHKLKAIKSYIVYNPTGNEVKVAFKKYTDLSILIESNVLLDGHRLILF